MLNSPTNARRSPPSQSGQIGAKITEAINMRVSKNKRAERNTSMPLLYGALGRSRTADLLVRSQINASSEPTTYSITNCYFITFVHTHTPPYTPKHNLSVQNLSRMSSRISGTDITPHQATAGRRTDTPPCSPAYRRPAPELPRRHLRHCTPADSPVYAT